MVPPGQDQDRQQAADHGSPDDQAALPDKKGAPGIGSKLIRPVVDHIEQSRAQETRQRDPRGRVVDLTLLKAFAFGLPGGQPNADHNSQHDYQAIPAQRQMTDGENNGVDIDSYHGG